MKMHLLLLLLYGEVKTSTYYYWMDGRVVNS
jgi:hypothetical protein